MIHKTYEYHIPEPDTQQRVRIAALDIGVDPNHPNMGSERIQSVRSWVNGENGKEEDRRASDESGHGTHTTVEEDDDSIMGDLFDSSSATSPSDTAYVDQTRVLGASNLIVTATGQTIGLKSCRRHTNC